MELHIELDDTYMNVIKFGVGKKNLTVIAGISLCGLEGSGKQLETALDAFTKDFTVYVFDRKKVIPVGYTMNQMADDIYRCMVQLEITKTSVYGTSQGGMLGILFTLAHPEMVENLVLCSTTAKNVENKAFTIWKEIAATKDVARLNKSFLEFVYSESFKKSIRDQIPELIRRGTGDDCHHFKILVESMHDFDITARLDEIKCPALVIYDKNDKIFDSSSGIALAERLGCSSIAYDQYSHAVYDEAPDLIEKIAGFCKGNS